MGFSGEKAVKATRKRHVCIACNQFIEIGEAAINWAGMNDGDFSSVYYHLECRAAEIAINDLHDCYGEDWMGLSDADREDYPWMKAEHPIAYRRLIMTREQYVATHRKAEER